MLPFSAVAVPAELIPASEPERLAALRRYEILDTPPDGSFDRLTAIAARHFGVPISIVTLVDHDRIWFKSQQGVPGVAQIDRVPGLCASAILQDNVWTVERADSDPRTLANPLVAGEFGLRFYAGAPLKTRDGHNLGTICVIDREPRAITSEETATLADLASIVVDELELRLAARRESERLEQTRADFVVTASHELRTPLTAVYGAAKTLTRTAASAGGLERELIELIETQSERLSDIVQKILLATQLENSELPLRLELHDAGEIARRSLDLVRPLSTRHRFELELPDDLPHVVADETHLRQALVNLLENAVKYSPDGGRVALELEPRGGRLRFLVHDEGIGIPAADQRRIFDRFVRLDPQLTGGVSGTGLGLHITRGFVARMGGSLTVSSLPGRGSTFAVELPAAAA